MVNIRVRPTRGARARAYLLRHGASQKKHTLLAAQHASDFVFERIEQQRVFAIHIKLAGAALLLGVGGEA